MARARIQINGVTQTTATVAIGVPVNLSNDDEGGEVTYSWTILDQPEGTADVISNSAIENPSFTPTKEGTYLLRLVVNSGTGTQAIATATAVVRDARTLERIPAAGEITETDAARGWATAINRVASRALHTTVDANLVIAQTPGGLGPGTIVRLTGRVTINAGTQSAFDVLQIALAQATVERRDRLGVLIDGISPGSIGVSALVLVRMFGLVPVSAAGSPAVGDPVYLSNVGTPSLTAGTVQRVIGYVVASSSGSYQWVIDSGVGIPDGAVTTAKLADSSVTSAKIANGTIATADIGNNQITNALLAQMPATTIKGNNTGGTANALDLTPAQLRLMVGGHLTGVQQLTAASGTYAPTSGTTMAIVEMIGGGGGGGGAGATPAASGGGGGSGVYLLLLVGTAGTALNGGAFTCGAGGTAGSAAGSNGGTGGDTTLTIGGLSYTAKGGTGGAGASGGSTVVSGGGVGGAGSTTGATVMKSNSWRGDTAYVISTTGLSAYGASSPMGTGGAPVFGLPGDGGAASGFGAGGAGGNASGSGHVGGAGSPGKIIVWEYA